jgi:drug/metabolite transporter (DMT)-like permease
VVGLGMAITLLLAWPLLSERPRPAFMVLTALTFAGVALLSWDGQFSSTISPIAIVLVLTGVICASSHSTPVKGLANATNLRRATLDWCNLQGVGSRSAKR